MAILFSIKKLASGKRLCFGPNMTGSPNTDGSRILCNFPENPPPI